MRLTKPILLTLIINSIMGSLFIILAIYVLYSSDKRCVILSRQITSLKLDLVDYARFDDVLQRASYVNDHINALYGMSYYISSAIAPFNFDDTLYTPTTQSLDSLYNHYKYHFETKYHNRKIR